MDTTSLRPPQQERSRRSLERILTAGADLLAERGYDGFAIAEVCSRAHVSAGALYGRFPSKDALILAIHEDVMRAMADEGADVFRDDAHWPEEGIADFVERAVRALLAHYERHERLLKVFILRSAVDPAMRRQGAASIARVAEAFSARLLTRSDELPHPDPAAAVRACFTIAFEAASWHVAFGADFDSALHTEAETIEDRLPVICRLYLLEGGAA